MLIREALEARMSGGDAEACEGLNLRLPLFLKSDRVSVRVSMMQRLASSPVFALGDRAGVLKAAQNRSGRAFRLDVRQRVIVKALVSRHIGKRAERGAALAKHLAYLGRSGAGADGAAAEFFDAEREGAAVCASLGEWSADRHHFRFIISPEHGDRIADLRDYAREVMQRVAADLGEPQLRWVAICHFDTDQPHAHVLVRGRKADGRDLVIPRDYMGYGFRARAQEVAQERLGDLTRLDAERRVWRETQAERFTGLDRRLIAAANGQGLVGDGVGGTKAWAALTRGRLRTLEGLGLAVREGRHYRLDPEVEHTLRSLEMRRDVIRTLNQRRLESGSTAQVARPGLLRGTVVSSGAHDELGARPYAVVRDEQGIEHYARLGSGAGLPKLGGDIRLQIGSQGLGQVVSGPRRGLGL